MDNLIDEFYRNKSGELVRFCRVTLYYQMIDGVDAEDIVQKVVIKAWEKRRQLASHPNLMGWFLNACTKECRALFREDSYRRKHMGCAVPLSDSIATSEQQDVILRWMAHQETTEFLSDVEKSLTPLERSVYEQYYVQGKAAKEAAEALDLKVGTVNDAARRIRKKATTIRYDIFIFLFTPILRLFCSIFNEGRQ